MKYSKNIQYIGINGDLLFSTPMERAHFFGFYDICPWSFSEQEVVLLSCEGDLLKTPSGEKAEVSVWNPKSGTVRKVAETRGWNFQHGARTQWLKDGTILFNDVQEGRQCARIIHSDGSPVRTLETAVSALHPSQAYGVASNYERLARFYPAYGYHFAKNPHIDTTHSSGDGFWRADLSTGQASLLLSYERVCADLKINYSSGMFMTHPVFSPSGEKIAFGLVENREGGSDYIWLIVYDIRLDTLSLLNGDKNSHTAWIDDNRLFVWARCSSAASLIRQSGLLSIPGVRPLGRLIRKWQGMSRNAVFSEGFYIFETEHDNRKKLMSPETISEDGHPSKHPSREVMLCDTYPDAEGYLTLFLYSLVTGKRVDVGRFFHGVVTTDPDMRCDLHPRWNRAGDRISVDYCEDGVRRVGVVDAAPALAKLME